MAGGLTFCSKQVDRDNCDQHCVYTFASATASALARSAFTLEIDMIKPPTTLTRRSVFRTSAGLAVAATATRLITPASARAGDARQPGSDPLHGGCFYRFKIGGSRAPR